MDDLEEDEDVIIEGSELHRALVDMGYTDFESTPIKENAFVTENDSIKEPLGHSNYKWSEMLCCFSKGLFLFNEILDNAPKAYYESTKQLATILRLESLLDDHAMIVQGIVKKNSKSSCNQFAGWSGIVASSTILGISYLMKMRKETLFIGTSLVFLTMCRKYKELQAIQALNDLVLVQNELYHLYKKGFRILRKSYRLKMDEKKIQSKFSTLEIDRLKYLQSITETLLKSMENVSRTYYYQASSMIVKLLPKKALPTDTLTHFEADAFAIEGEITYEKLRHLYYVYVLVQSDTMLLLAIAYDADLRLDMRIDGERISDSLLTRIVVNLHDSLMNHKNQLVPIFMEYENCTTRAIQRKFRVTTTSKWRDLYLNLDLLSSKVQTIYDAIGFVLNEMDKRESDEITEDDFITELIAKTQDIYEQIDKAKHFAEFNNLLVAIIQRSRHAMENAVSESVEYVPEIGDERSIVRDSEPQIIDEVFEEYITDEYLKPLYEENDEATLDIAKFDKILVKTFISELKDALLSKYNSMSEREAKALLNKYRDRGECSKSEENIVNEVSSELYNEKLSVPNTTPLPLVAGMPPQLRAILEENQKGESRGPVPLPRAITRSRNVENILPTRISQRSPVTLLLPLPSSPSPIPPLSKNEACESTDRFSFDLPKLCDHKLPAFVTCAEEFIGSGENSEEDLGNSDCEDDASLENVPVD